MFLTICLALLTQSPAPVENVSSFPPRSPYEELKALHVPEGFEVQLVAAEPAIQKPMNIAFDDQGRLWVTGTIEYPYPAKEGTRGRDTVKILEDFQADGRAAKITTFADGLNIPIGLIPLPSTSGALVYDIPAISRRLDTDGDGKADEQVTLYRDFGHRDTHGMTGSFCWGFDGWIYACHGFSNTSDVKASRGNPLSMNSGNIYRMKMDGSHAEYFTHGQVNPFGLTFDPLGNLYSSDCHSKPLYQLLRGAYYPSFGKPDDGLGFGPEMMSHNHGSTAIDGATYYAADEFPPSYRGTLFTGNVMTNRINHDRLEFKGSSPWAIEQPDFLWSEDNWFRPVDIELGPDGALYVADFYNRIIGHYEVPLTHPGRDHLHGRIWRIVYTGKTKGARPKNASRGNWTRATTDELIEDLGHPNLVVRTKAANQLVSRKAEDLDQRLAALFGSETNPWRRIHLLWVLHRRDQLDDGVLEHATEDPASEVRVHAMRLVAERARVRESLLSRARALLKDQDPLVRRCAAEALGRHPEDMNVPLLLELWKSTPAEDTHLIHVTRMAIRDHFLTPSSWNAVSGTSRGEREAASIAEIALGVPTSESAGYLLAHLERSELDPGFRVRVIQHVARHGAEETSQKLEAFVQKLMRKPEAGHAELLKAVQRGTQERGSSPRAATRGLALILAQALIKGEDVGARRAGLDLVQAFKLNELNASLVALVTDPKQGDLRAEALPVLVAIGPLEAIPTLARVLGDSTESLPLREKAAVTLAGIRSPHSLDALIRTLPTAPSSLQGAIATGLAGRKNSARALVQAVAEGKASARLLQDRRVSVLIGNLGDKELETRVASLVKDLPPFDSRVKSLLDARRDAYARHPGQPEAGRTIFEKHCVACHQIGGKGQRIGPQLDGIGARGLERLLEDVVDPNQNVDQAFRVTSVALRDGQLVTGLLMKEEGEVLVFADSQGKEVRVAKDQVEERTTSQISPMPANLIEQIQESDFLDLLSFLLTQTSTPTP